MKTTPKLNRSIRLGSLGTKKDTSDMSNAKLRSSLRVALSCAALSFFVWSGWQFVNAGSMGATRPQAETESTESGGGQQHDSIATPFVKPFRHFAGAAKRDESAPRPDGAEPEPFVFGDANQDFPIAADFDGDKTIDAALYRSSTNELTIRRSSDLAVETIQFGVAGDGGLGITGDYDGDGKADPANFRCPTTVGQCNFKYRSSMTLAVVTVPWGEGAESVVNPIVPYPGDFDGDGKFDFCVYKKIASTGENQWRFELKRSSDGGTENITLGNFNTDWLVPGDYDGDGKTDFMLARTGATASAPMQWILRTRVASGPNPPIVFGVSSDQPAPGDHDGDGKVDIVVRRTSGGASTKRILRSSDSLTQVLQIGMVNDFDVATWNVT